MAPVAARLPPVVAGVVVRRGALSAENGASESTERDERGLIRSAHQEQTPRIRSGASWCSQAIFGSGSPWSDPVGVAPSVQLNRADSPPGFTGKRPVSADRLSLENDHGVTLRTLESPSAPREHYVNRAGAPAGD